MSETVRAESGGKNHQVPFVEAIKNSDPQVQSSLVDMAMSAGIPTDDPLWVIVSGLNHLSTFDQKVEVQLNTFDEKVELQLKTFEGLLQTSIRLTFDAQLKELDARLKLSNGVLLQKIMETGVSAGAGVSRGSSALDIGKAISVQRMELAAVGTMSFLIALGTAFFVILPIQLNSKITEIQNQVSRDTSWAITPSGYKAKAIYELNGSYLKNCKSEAKKQSLYVIEAGKKITENLCVLKVP